MISSQLLCSPRSGTPRSGYRGSDFVPWHTLPVRCDAAIESGYRITFVVGVWPAACVFMSSRPGEFHPQALPKPCMTLSSHTAPDVQPLP